MRTPTASIVIPSFNSQAYLPRCIESVRRQTCEDIQIVCVDNGSTDDSKSILERAAAEDTRITVLSQPKAGVSQARNTGIEASTGRYILFVDADDFIEPQAAEAVCAHAARMDAQMTMYSFDEYYEQPEAFVPRERCEEAALYERAFSLADCQSLSVQIVTPNVWRIAFDREFLQSTGMRFEPSLRTSEDLLFIYQCLFRADRLALLPDVLYHYRRTRRDSLTRVDRGDDGVRALGILEDDAKLLMPARPWIARHLANMILDTFEYQLGSSAVPQEFKRLYEELRQRWLPSLASCEDLIVERYRSFYQRARSCDAFEYLFSQFISQRENLERAKSAAESLSHRAQQAEGALQGTNRQLAEILDSRSWKVASAFSSLADKARKPFERN